MSGIIDFTSAGYRGSQVPAASCSDLHFWAPDGNVSSCVTPKQCWNRQPFWNRTHPTFVGDDISHGILADGILLKSMKQFPYFSQFDSVPGDACGRTAMPTRIPCTIDWRADLAYSAALFLEHRKGVTTCELRPHPSSLPISEFRNISHGQFPCG